MPKIPLEIQSIVTNVPSPVTKFTHIAVEKITQRKIAILAPVLGRRIYDLVREWADDAWEELFQAGKVDDALLGKADER